MIRLLLPFLLLASFSVFAQGKQKADPWDKIDSLVSIKHLPKSALKEVKKLYAQAKAKGDEPTAIKALIYTIDLQAGNREDAEKKGLMELQAEQRKASGISKAILSSLLAERYNNFSNDVSSPDSPVSFDRNDLDTWTSEDLRDEARRLYLASIENRELLQHTRVADYDTIIVKGQLRNLRPTLYDLLAHRALGFLSETDYYESRNGSAFKLDQSMAFAPAADFAAHRFVLSDSASSIYQAVIIYQHLLSFHLHDAKPDALIDADIDRLDFMRKWSLLTDREEYYHTALERMTSFFGLKPASVMAWYRLADYYADLAKSYQPFTDTVHRYEKIKAEALLKRIVADSNALKNSYGWSSAFTLLNELHKTSYYLRTLHVNLPGQPFLSLVTYANIRRLYLRILPVNGATLRLFNSDRDKYWRTIAGLKPVRSWQQDLPDAKDLQEHSTEIKIEGLPAGEYILLSSINGHFQTKDSTDNLESLTIRTSRIVGISENDNLFVLDRETGRPLAGAQVTISSLFYNYQTRKTVERNEKPVTADANGYVHIASPPRASLLRGSVKINYGNDSLTLSNSLYVRSLSEIYDMDTSTSTADKATTISLFSDRGIYRPGQTVHFKGIASIRGEDSKPSLRTDYSSVVYLSGYDGQLVDSVSVSTNEYGSFWGTLRLPANLLTGMFYLKTKKGIGSAAFSVEEYKRPKFNVSFDSVKQAYRLNDRVHITGKAMAFAGNSIGGATVKYTVTRHSLIFYDWMPRNYDSGSPMIASGETVTDANGNFSIDFDALADPARDTTDGPAFNIYTLMLLTLPAKAMHKLRPSASVPGLLC